MDMRNGANEAAAEEPSVSEGAFWHTNMDLYYGYQPGEVVEVEHEPDKYWLASIRYCYKHLVLLKWVGNYGKEFWVDTSITHSIISSATSSSGAPSEPFGNPKRLYALGHHLQPQLRSQFTLEKPSKILEKPSLYNPAKDPYANVRTVEDLLKHEVEEIDKDDAFAITPKTNSDTASFALAKCKSKINYGQEDEDELEAALQSLTSFDPGAEQEPSESPQDVKQEQASTISTVQYKGLPEPPVANDMMTNGISSQSETRSSFTGGSERSASATGLQKGDELYWTEDHEIGNKSSSEVADEEQIQNRELHSVDTYEEQSWPWKSVLVELKERNDIRDGDPFKANLFKFESECWMSDEELEKLEDERRKITDRQYYDNDDDARRDRDSLELCKEIQNSAMTTGRYVGVDPSEKIPISPDDIVYPAKPKLLFDVGGANHERLLVRGTLLSICHTIENDSGQLDVFQWIAIVVRNVGGRLTLRWFLCDEPKFKQGRLEMKSCLSRFVSEDFEQTPANTGSSSNSNNNYSSDTNHLHGDGNKVITHSLADRFTGTSFASHLSAKGLTFSMHFCNPRIHSIPGTANGLDYKFPNEISSLLAAAHGQECVTNLEKIQLDHVFDARRINLDRDRPLINHILTAVRSKAPAYLDLIFGKTEGTRGRREVLISSPKMTKMVRATVRRELGPGVFEVHSDPLNGSDEIIKFIYPYDSSYSILPVEWSINNSDCLSVHPSRNPSPSANTSEQGDKEEKPGGLLFVDEEWDSSQILPECLRMQRAKFPRPDTPFEIPEGPMGCDASDDESLDFHDPACWMKRLRNKELKTREFHCCLDYQLKEKVESQFKVMDRLEIFHPTSDHIICTGRIRKVVFPMLWIQLSSDCYTLVPFDVTDIYPVGWCDSHELKLVSLLPPRRRNATEMEGNKKRPRKKAKTSKASETKFISPEDMPMDENFDLVNLEDRQAGIDYILKERSSYVKIFFNHKCFTGPSLSKSKICTLPQYVGPGPMRLVIEEVVTKLISVAYVPPRVLNDLSSKSFEELLIERNLTNTAPVEFKAKYQKRVHRDKVPVCLNPDDVALYCECVCEHIKCCYNLFGLSLYDGDFCPSNCRSLTKSNKFMKRATYYREKARQGEVVVPPEKNQDLIDDESPHDDNRKDANGKALVPTPAAKTTTITTNTNGAVSAAPPSPVETLTPEMEPNDTTTRARYNGRGSSDSTNSSNMSRSDEEMDTETLHKISEWTIDDVARYMEERQLGIFKTYMLAEGIDGQALMLLDRPAIEEHFQLQTKSEITQEDVNKLCDTVDLFRTFSKIY